MLWIVLKQRKHIKKIGFWVFTFLGGGILIMMDQADVEPFFTLTSLVYWALLLFWSASWLMERIGALLKGRKEKYDSELKHLQSQVNPHFFFNTLNNLYGLIDKDSTKAKEMVLKLSDMMRYSIYDGQKERVKLEEEVSYLNNYIELHKGRYHKKTNINFVCRIQAEGLKIMPLLFIILLENAFKHGVENLSDEAFVDVSLYADTDEIRFSVTNNFDKNIETNKEGIGLRNLKRRLELVYPDKHLLSYSANGNIFKSELVLNLK